MASQIITVNDLYKLFFKKKLVNLKKMEPASPVKTISQKKEAPSPSFKAISDAMSPRSKAFMEREMMEDDIFVENLEAESELTDPDYLEKMENGYLGFFMENFVSVYFPCPVCGKYTLKKYVHSNVPVVDLVCINKDYHMASNECFIYQLKISLTNDYFDASTGRIAVGSRAYGDIAHLHKPSEDIKIKRIVPGYICIKLRKRPNESQSYTIDKDNSFVIVPDYNSTSSDFFYEYLPNKNKYGKPEIKWNNSSVKSFWLNAIYKGKQVDHEYFSETDIDNPYQDLKL